MWEPKEYIRPGIWDIFFSSAAVRLNPLTFHSLTLGLVAFLSSSLLISLVVRIFHFVSLGSISLHLLSFLFSLFVPSLLLSLRIFVSSKLLLLIHPIITKLIDIIVTGNKIGDEGATSIAHSLNGNTSLTRIDLGDCSIGSKGGQQLGNALSLNQSVTDINLKGKKNSFIPHSNIYLFTQLLFSPFLLPLPCLSVKRQLDGASPIAEGVLEDIARAAAHTLVGL